MEVASLLHGIFTNFSLVCQGAINKTILGACTRNADQSEDYNAISDSVKLDIVQSF